MSYIGRSPTYGAFEKQSLTADGSTTTFALTYVVGSTASLLVSVGGVVQEPTTAYTLSGGGANIVFSAAPSSGDRVYVHFLGRTQDVGTPADNSVTLAKQEHGTQGDVLYYGSSGAPARLSAGTSGQFLKTQGSGANPTWGSISTTSISDADSNTKIQVEESSDENIIRFDVAGTETSIMTAKGLELGAAGGFFLNQTTNTQTVTIAAAENAMMVGPVAFSGTVTVAGVLAII
jgi:hypothetical protein